MTMALEALPNPVAWFEGRQASDVKPRHFRIGRWTLVTVPDAFTGTVRCTLRAPSMSYGPVAMFFNMGGGTNTDNAVYRINDGPAVSWRTNAMALAAGGVMLQTDDLVNPSGGRVIVPIAMFGQAHNITIRANPNGQPRRFDLTGLPEALQESQKAKCRFQSDSE